MHNYLKFSPLDKSPLTGMHITPEDWRFCHPSAAWAFNPWTGEPRDARDKGSDPFGYMIPQPGVAMLAARKPMDIEAARNEAAFAQGVDFTVQHAEVQRQLGTKPTTAPDLLIKAAGIMAERGKQYDKPGGERSIGKCVAAFNLITGQDLTEAEGWLLLQVLKDVRMWQRPGYHQDSAEDCIAYASLKAEAKQREAVS